MLIWPIVAAVALSTIVVNVAHAGQIVVPGVNTSTEGNSNLNAPFSRGAIATNGRFQQVYSASEFTSFGGSFSITELRFRPNAQGGSAGHAFSETLPAIQIDLSTTSAQPDALSTTFANNVGADDRIVFSGPLTLSSAFTGPASGPKDFDIVIHLQTAFFYNPLLGNLLFDVRFPDGSGPDLGALFDAQNIVADSISIVLNDNAFSGGPATLTNGLVTEFVFVAVPMPPALILVLVGISAIALTRRRK